MTTPEKTRPAGQVIAVVAVTLLVFLAFTVVVLAQI